jgi:hypothetical protein
LPEQLSENRPTKGIDDYSQVVGKPEVISSTQERPASALRRRVVHYCFLNSKCSVIRWPDSRVPVVDTVIRCPSAETTDLSF